MKKTHVQRLMVAEMRMIRWMCGYTRLDKIRNVEIRERVGIAPLEDKMREIRLRWFGHVKRRSVSAPMRRCEAFDILQCRRGRGRPKTSWNTVIRSDMKCLGLTEDMAQDRNTWRVRIRIIDVVLKCYCKCTMPVAASNGKYGSYPQGTRFQVPELFTNSI